MNRRTLTLTFDEIEEQHFGRYYLYVENDVGEARITIRLEEGEGTKHIPPPVNEGAQMNRRLFRSQRSFQQERPRN